MPLKSEVFSLSIAFALSIILSPYAVQSASLILYDTSLENNIEVPFGEAEKLMPHLNTELMTIFYAAGYTGLPNGTASETMISTYLSLGNCNVIQVNWTEEASNPYLTTFAGYTFHAAPNAKPVGEFLALDIVKMVDLGLKAAKTHLLGLSLGAHMMGYAGRKTKEEGVILYRVTGLDPAGLYFDPSIFFTPINQDSAAFVDCLHTDIGHCGERSGSCDVDIYFNYGNYDSLFDDNVQPGCEPGIKLCGNLCSHNRSVYYWTEALKFLENFLAGKAGSYEEYVHADGDFDVTTYVGYLCNTSYRGDFYLSTNAASPYGRKEAGLKVCLENS